MKIGWIGLGKLGLPCALACEDLAAGDVDVIGYDSNPAIITALRERRHPAERYEVGLSALLAESDLELAASIGQVVAATDELVFVAVQTPHDPRYGGEAPAPHRPADFDYRWLRDVAEQVNAAATAQEKPITLVVISTALPGTMRREILPRLTGPVRLVYNPFFIAMGSTLNDYWCPEFVLVGADDPDARDDLVEFYRKLYARRPAIPMTWADGDSIPPVLAMGIEEAELTKVSYNTFISLKIVFANTLGEIAEGLNERGARVDVDVVTGALQQATRRLISPMYLTAGVGDGGACHPRDNIAMSWLAHEFDLSVDPFRFVTLAREAHSMQMARRLFLLAEQEGLPVIVLGKAYKPQSTLTAGSPGALLVNQLLTLGAAVQWWDPMIDTTPLPTGPDHGAALYVLMTRHEVFAEAEPSYPAGSVLIDPFRFVTAPPEVALIRLGEPRRAREWVDPT
jgi:UDPglucose 6-dehydrogenase